MTTRKQSTAGALLLTLALALPTAGAQEEGVQTGVVQQVDPATGVVVIDGQRYRYGGKVVQPPPDVSTESENYRERAFARGMIVQFTVAPGDPPGILEAWALDQ